MNLFELRGGEHVLALEGFEIVGESEFFKEPEDALGPGFFKPIWESEGGLVRFRYIQMNGREKER